MVLRFIRRQQYARVPPGDNNYVLDTVTSLTESTLNSFRHPRSLAERKDARQFEAHIVSLFLRGPINWTCDTPRS